MTETVCAVAFHHFTDRLSSACLKKHWGTFGTSAVTYLELQFASRTQLNGRENSASADTTPRPKSLRVIRGLFLKNDQRRYQYFILFKSYKSERGTFQSRGHFLTVGNRVACQNVQSLCLWWPNSTFNVIPGTDPAHPAHPDFTHLARMGGQTRSMHNAHALWPTLLLAPLSLSNAEALYSCTGVKDDVT